MTKPRLSLEPANDQTGRRAPVRPPARKIIVSPDQIFPQETVAGRKLSFEGVVVRYVLVSAVVVISICALAMLATTLLGR
ncbi:MAG TPA: hypothetical protein VGN38_12230 [Caulobacteraceae bacterium]|nr:hypothetical protein [Caulobacteraceae bacterium]